MAKSGGDVENFMIAFFGSLIIYTAFDVLAAQGIVPWDIITRGLGGS